MRYFFNVVKGGQQLQDFEGGDFESDLDAEVEGRMIAREIVGRELITGKAVGWSSTIEVVREDNVLVAVFSFRQAVHLPSDD